MRYNNSYSENGGDFNEYIEYMNTIKEYIPAELYDFVSDPSRHDFSDRSLHDSRIEEIQFTNEFEENGPDMVITLLGENRKFKLHYFDISKYRIEQYYGINDLLTYEIGMENHEPDEEEQGPNLVFRSLFSDGGEIEICCQEMRIEEILD
jgi:hypothetical protein